MMYIIYKLSIIDCFFILKGLKLNMFRQLEIPKSNFRVFLISLLHEK